MCIEKMAKKILDIVARIESNPEYAELLSSFDHLKNKTVFDALTSLPDMILIEYPSLLQEKNLLKVKFSQALIDYDQVKGNRVDEKVKNYLELKDSEPIQIKDVHFNGTKKEADLLVDFINDCTKLFPEKYKENLVLNYYISTASLDSFSSFDVENQHNIVLSSNQDIEPFAAQLMHEVGHVIENNTPSIKAAALDFLHKRAPNLRLEELSAHTMSDEDVRVKVLPGRFIEPYVGRIYGSPESIQNTEVISVGLQSLFLNPVIFLFKDTEHFMLIYNVLKGNHA